MDAERIPEDIKKAARRVVERGYNEGLLEAVEKALLAERERCAKIADAHAECECDCGDVIAAAIRKP